MIAERAPDMYHYFVIDDDSAFREKLCEMLRARGNSASSFASGRAAIEDGVSPPDRIVLDLRMPGESGLSVLPKLKSQFPACDILLLTGFGSISTAVECMKRGAKSFITKPAALQQILEAFEENAESPTKNPPLPSLEEIEWAHIQRVLTEFNGNISQTARALGIHRRSLQRKLLRRAK